MMKNCMDSNSNTNSNMKAQAQNYEEIANKLQTLQKEHELLKARFDKLEKQVALAGLTNSQSQPGQNELSTVTVGLIAPMDTDTNARNGNCTDKPCNKRPIASSVKDEVNKRPKCEIIPESSITIDQATVKSEPIPVPEEEWNESCPKKVVAGILKNLPQKRLLELRLISKNWNKCVQNELKLRAPKLTQDWKNPTDVTHFITFDTEESVSKFCERFRDSHGVPFAAYKISSSIPMEKLTEFLELCGSNPPGILYWKDEPLSKKSSLGEFTSKCPTLEALWIDQAGQFTFDTLIHGKHLKKVTLVSDHYSPEDLTMISENLVRPNAMPLVEDFHAESLDMSKFFRSIPKVNCLNVSIWQTFENLVKNWATIQLEKLCLKIDGSRTHEAFRHGPFVKHILETQSKTLQDLELHITNSSQVDFGCFEFPRKLENLSRMLIDTAGMNMMPPKIQRIRQDVILPKLKSLTLIVTKNEINWLNQSQFPGVTSLHIKAHGVCTNNNSVKINWNKVFPNILDLSLDSNEFPLIEEFILAPTKVVNLKLFINEFINTESEVQKDWAYTVLDRLKTHKGLKQLSLECTYHPEWKFGLRQLERTLCLMEKLDRLIITQRIVASGGLDLLKKHHEDVVFFE